MDAQETAEDAAVLKRYRISQLVGSGNYARVYRAHALNGKELAIKSINLTKTSDNYKTKFLPSELTILRKISHPNICKIYEITQITDRIFIVMQFCAKGTIADLLQRNGPMSENLTRYLFAPTVDAIVYLHSMDVAHRDIKVENILLDHNYIPKLTDFSYSVFTNEIDTTRLTGNTNADTNHYNNTTNNEVIYKSNYNVNKSVFNTRQAIRPLKTVDTGGSGGTVQKLKVQAVSRQNKLNDTFCGTLPYLSPEMIRQHSYDPKKTDVWSLGICFYVMLNDRLPFPFDDIKLMVKKQLAKDYKFKADVGEHCRSLMSLLLEPEFVRRPTSLDASRHPWMVCGPRERPSH